MHILPTYVSLYVSLYACAQVLPYTCVLICVLICAQILPTEGSSVDFMFWAADLVITLLFTLDLFISMFAYSANYFHEFYTNPVCW